MKVLWIAPFPHPDSQNTHPAPWLSTMLQSLVGIAGVEIEVVNITSSRQLQFIQNNVKYTFLQGPSLKIDLLTLFVLRVSRLYRWVKENQGNYDVIHVHGTEHQYEFGLWNLDIPYVVSIQGILKAYLPFWRGKLKTTASRWLGSKYEILTFRKGKYYLGRTDWDRSWVRKLSPNSVYLYGPELIRSEFFHDFELRASDQIAFIGGSNGLKGLDFLLDVINHIHLNKEFLELNIIGNCPPKWIEAAKSNERYRNIDWSKVEFCGMLEAPEIIKIYKESICLVHPSLIDNSPNSICEAQVLGLPVVASPVGGVPSLIEHNETGFLIEHDVLMFSECLQNLKSNLELRIRIADSAKKVARQRHNSIDGGAIQVDIYTKVIDQWKL